MSSIERSTTASAFGSNSARLDGAVGVIGGLLSERWLVMAYSVSGRRSFRVMDAP